MDTPLLTRIGRWVRPLLACRSELARMREPVLTPEQAAAARCAAVLEREKSHAAAEERMGVMLQVRMKNHT